MKLKKKEKKVEIVNMELRPVRLDIVADHPELKKSYRALDPEWAEALSQDIERNGLDTPLIVWNTGDPDVEQRLPIADRPSHADNRAECPDQLRKTRDKQRERGRCSMNAGQQIVPEFVGH